MRADCCEAPDRPVVRLVCATRHEAEPLFKAFGQPAVQSSLFNSAHLLYSWLLGDWQVLLNICGIGSANTALHLGCSLVQALEWGEPLIQFGIAGTYVLDVPLAREIYEVVEETYADLGAHTPEGFRDLEQMGFSNFVYAAATQVPDSLSALPSTYYNRLANPAPSPLALPKVQAATVQAVSGDDASIARVRTYAPDAVLESMEGAAFFQVGLCFSRPFYQFRAVSNHVVARDPARWKIRPAIERVGEFVVELLRAKPDWLNLQSAHFRSPVKKV